MLDSQGCKFLSSNGVLKVFKGDWGMLRGTKVGNLYRLVGGVLTRGAKARHQSRSMDRVGKQGDWGDQKFEWLACECTSWSIIQVKV